MVVFAQHAVLIINSSNSPVITLLPTNDLTGYPSGCTLIGNGNVVTTYEKVYTLQHMHVHTHNQRFTINIKICKITQHLLNVAWRIKTFFNF